MTYRPIESYALIGDMHSAALVSHDGTIDYLCLPAFDSPTVFAALLDHAKGGHFAITPTARGSRIRQFYVPDTNILLTRFLSEQGVAEVVDFMPIPDGQGPHRVVRWVKGIRGRVDFTLECRPAFDYARSAHDLVVDGGRALFTPRSGEQPPLQLRGTIDLAARDGGAVAGFTLAADESACFMLEVADDGDDGAASTGDDVEDAFDRTLRYWRDWMNRGSYRGRWSSAVNRSALAMKLLTSARHGSIAAAATFGLPESLRGERNWDYRFAWIRDASLTAATLIDLGYHDEARGFARWLFERYRDSDRTGELQIMYGIDGRKHLEESVLAHLDGYRQSRPVRVGNAAYNQLQLDIYGEMLLFLDRYDAVVEPLYNDIWRHVATSVDWVCRNWDREDEGVWEVRGGQRKFLYSRLMSWVALDRALRIADRRSLPGPIETWRATRDRIHDEIYDNFWDEKRGVFVQYRGGAVLDASCLLMPIVGFVAPRDPRWLSTLDAVGEELVDDSLVYRYRTDIAASDGLSGSEGTFCMCSFWYADCLARAGEAEKARLIFEKMLHYAGPAGLYSEELGPTGHHLGNYPQAFTHLGLVWAARSLDAALDRTEAEITQAPR